MGIIRFSASWICLVLALGLAVGQGPNPVPNPPAKANAENLDGTWLFESAWNGDRSLLADCWDSQLIIRGNAFKLTRFMGVDKELMGGFDLDTKTNPRQVDLILKGLDLSSLNIPLKVPEGKVEGIYQLHGDRLELCIALSSMQLRPTGFQSLRLKSVHLIFTRVDPKVRSDGKAWLAETRDGQAKPVAGATLFSGMVLRSPEPGKWNYKNGVETAENGQAKIGKEMLKGGWIGARQASQGLIGFGQLSPAALHRGVISIEMVPETKISGTVYSSELKEKGKPLGNTYVYLEKLGFPRAMCVNPEGKYEFFAPPGQYSLYATGPTLQSQTVPLPIFPETKETQPDPIDLKAQPAAFKTGETAPEFQFVAGWVKGPVKMSQYRGKYVLLHFWGFWNPQSVMAMNTMIDLHEKYSQQNLAIVSVHIDALGELSNPALFDQRIQQLKATQWNNREIPFPVALCSGRRFEEAKRNPEKGGPSAQYGIFSLPGTILVDPEGKIVECFPGIDPEAAEARIKGLLAR